MLEYVFFNAEPRARFCAFLSERGIEATLAEGETELLVQVHEDAVDDQLADALDAYYDEMFALDQEIHGRHAATGGDEYQGSGVVVNLKDGTAVYAEIPPALLNKVMQALTLSELSDLVNAIADAVENPDPRSLCQRARDRDTQDP
jgi:hypothetical protein